MAAVLVTGACGRLGSQIVRRLVAAGRKVLATDRVPAPADAAQLWGEDCKGKVEFVQADLADPETAEKLAERCGPAVHLAALPGPSAHPPPGVDASWSAEALVGLETVSGLDLLRQNLLGTCSLFEALARRRDGRRVVFSSSLFAMGYCHDPSAFAPRYLPLDEDHSPMPLEHYGLSKAMAEDFAGMLVRADSGLGKAGVQSGGRDAGPSFVMLRFSNIVKAEKWAELPWPAPAKPVTPLMWGYCHEHDVVEAHLLALDLPCDAMPSRCESFILAADDTRFDAPTEELIRQHWGGRKAPPLRRALPGFSSIVSNAKVKNVLGLAPRSFRAPAPEASLGPAQGQRQWSIFKAPEGFRLKGGEVLNGGFLAYKTYGALNPDKSNAVLHPTSFDAVHWELEYNVGPGRMLDTDKYFVVIVNLLGNGVSLSPSTCGPAQRYPVCGASVCDNVRLQALLLDGLGISRLAMIYGYSMGAMQALHWGVMFPERVLRIAAVCGSARTSDYNAVFLDSLEAALLADPDIREDPEGRPYLVGGCEKGLETFARIYAGWGVPMEFYHQELWSKSSRDGVAFSSREDFVRRSYIGGFASANPLNLMAQMHAWKTADVSRAHGLPPGATLAEALGRVRARVYLAPCTTDRYFTVPEIQAEAALLPNCRFAPLESAWGHRAGDPHRPGQEEDARWLKALVGELLSEAVQPADGPGADERAGKRARIS